MLTNTANTCQRNAECITSSGSSLWCTGPKIGTCFVFDRRIARTWTTADVSFRTPRAFAASVFLPDGRTWVLGGAGSSSILKTTEFITLDAMSHLRIVPGPDMLEPLMYHSAAWISATQVVVLGGFSPVTSDYSPNAFVYDFETLKWTTKPW